MKKKEKSRKKPEMPEFVFKEFTPEENKIYEEAVSKYRGAVVAGMTLRRTYDSYVIEDEGLRNLIHADFLKILIAERHFAQGQGLDDIAKALDVSPDLIKETHARMLQEVGISAANQFGQQYGPLTTPTND